MTRSELLTALRGWVAQAVATLDDQTVVNYKGPKGDDPRPATTYAAVELTAVRNLGSTPFRRTTTTPDPNDPDPDPPKSQKFVKLLRRERLATFRVRMYGAGALDLVDELRDSVMLEASKKLFRATGISVQDRSEVMDLTQLRDTVHEPHAQVDFHVGWCHELQELTPIIETMNHASTLTPAGS